MICVKTKLDKSDIAGIGLFADELIPQGTIVWKFEPLIDILLSKEEIGQLTKASQDQFYNYAYLDKKRGKYLLCGDDARFFNHSENPNCHDEMLSDVTVASRDIQHGEEITCNYKDFYVDIENHSEIINL